MECTSCLSIHFYALSWCIVRGTNQGALGFSSENATRFRCTIELMASTLHLQKDAQVEQLKVVLMAGALFVRVYSIIN